MPFFRDSCAANEIRDPDLDGVSVTITQVKPSPDMRYATVYCEPLGGQNGKEIVAALNRHKGFLRGEIGRMIAIKFTPDLRFVEDDSFAKPRKSRPSSNRQRCSRTFPSRMRATRTARRRRVNRLRAGLPAWSGLNGLRPGFCWGSAKGARP